MSVNIYQSPGSHVGCSNFVDLLRYRAEYQGDSRAFTYLVDGERQEETISYAELDRRAKAIGAWLQAMGLGGERALLLYPAGNDFIAAYMGCLYGGVVAVPAYPPRRNRKMTRIESIAADAEAKVALCTSPVLEQVQGVIDQTPSLTKLHWAATDALEPGLEDRWRRPHVHDDMIAFLQYTSGSTGTPKGVMLTHRNLMHNSAQISYAFELTRSGSGVYWLPSYHDMGLIGGILQPLYLGRPNVFMSPMSFLQKPFRWLSAISRFRCSTSGGPNFCFDHCVEKVTEEQKAELDLSSWCVAFNGAEPVRKSTIDRFVEAFAQCGFRREAFYPCYGLAEATLIVTGGYKLNAPVTLRVDSKALENHQVIPVGADHPQARELVGSGDSLLDQRVEIADPDTMTRVPPGRVGEVWVSGPSVAKGYWKRPSETEHTFHAYLKDNGDGPFMRTGDLGFVQDGELYITGRLKDLIIIRGRNHYPQDIELTAEHSHERVRGDCVAAFVVEAEGRERLVLVAEVDRRSDEFAQQIMDSIRGGVSAEHEVQLDAIVLIKAGSIPKTSSGKIQRHAARESFLEHTLDVVAESRNWQARETDPDTLEVSDIASTNGHRRPAVSMAGAGAPVCSDSRTIEVVMDHVRKVGKERAAGLTPDTNIVQMGLDSLERVDILASLQEVYGGRLPDHVLPNIETPREVAAAIEQYLGTQQQSRASIPADQPIPEDFYRVEQFPEYLRLKQTMNDLDAAGLKNPYFTAHEGLTSDTTVIDGREYINFSSYNYLGMSGDPEVSRASQEAIDRFGTSVSASRLVSGEKTLHRELEQVLADFVGTPAAMVFVSGHATNETVIGHLMGPGDLILHDALAHNSILQGCILSGARRRSFPHNDWRTADEILTELRRQYRRVLIAIEGVYSMDGDFPELPKFIEVKKRHQAMLYIDEAHSIGTMGPHGRGIGEHYDVDASDVDVWMGTLSKALGACGGYIAGSAELIEYLKYTTPGFVYSAGLSPPSIGAALAALRLLEEEPERVARLAKRSHLFLQLAQAAGLNTGHSRQTPVVPVITGSSASALALSQALYARGINVQPILYPAVEDAAARLRFFITAKHTEEQIRETVAAAVEELRKIDPQFARKGSRDRATVESAVT